MNTENQGYNLSNDMSKRWYQFCVRMFNKSLESKDEQVRVEKYFLRSLEKLRGYDTGLADSIEHVYTTLKNNREKVFFIALLAIIFPQFVPSVKHYIIKGG